VIVRKICQIEAEAKKRRAPLNWVFITQLHIHTMRGNAHTST